MGMRSERSVIGRIVRPHGIQGEMLVRSLSDIESRFDGLKELWLVRSGVDLGRFEVVRIRAMAKGIGLRLRGVDDRNKAADLRGVTIEAGSLDSDALDEDEFFITDLIGLQIVSDDGSVLGIVDDVTGSPGQDLLIVKDGDTEWQLPFVDEFVEAVDLDAGTMVVRLIDGLRDL
jgi:16S rRNA processing protein RimM